jgi:lipoprotein-releasing system permease protein
VVVGTVVGLGLVGVLAALGIPRFSSELASIYMVSRIPWQVRLGDVLWVVAAGAFEVLLASVAAARPLASRKPAEVLRWV